MYYRGYGPPVKCPRCEAPNNPVREECRLCNCPLENYCSDELCMTLNVEKARFCKCCGKPTLFNQYRVFDEEVRNRYVISARNYFLINGDPDSPEEKARAAREHRQARIEMGLWREEDDIPEPPLEPDYIPYW